MNEKVFHNVLILLLLLLCIGGISRPALGDDNLYGEWASLRAQGKFDVLAERLEIEVEDLANPLPVRLAGAMQLVEIYSLRMVDFNAADRAIEKAGSLNEALFGAEYVENLKRLRQCREFLALQRGQLAVSASRAFDRMDDLFVFPATDLQRAQERLARIEAVLESGKDEPPAGVPLAAAVIAAVEAEDYTKGAHYWNLLQQAVAAAEAETAARAEKVKKERRKAAWDGLWRGVGTVYLTAGMAFATWVTFGTEAERAWDVTKGAYSNLADTYAGYQRTRRLSVDSEFASGLNLFLGYPNQVRVLAAVGTLHQERGEMEKAAPFFRQGIEISEMLRATLRSEKERIAFQSVRNDLYDRMIAVLMATGQVEEALAYSERARSRAFLDALAGGKIELREDQGRELYAGISQSQAELSVLMANTQLSDAQVDWAERKVRGIAIKPTEGPAATRNLIQITDVVAPDLDALGNKLKSDQAILTYFCGSHGTFGWLITKEGVSGKSIDLDRDHLRSAVAAMLKEVSGRHAGPNADLLYRHLIAPFRDRIGARRVLIIPHDALHTLPFGALRQGDRYLAQDLSLHYSPSIAVWQLLKDRNKERSRRDSILLVGKPLAGEMWPDLLYADQEIETIARLFGKKATLLTGDQATKGELRRRAKDHDVLHVLSHGYFDDTNPLESGLVLTGGQQGILRGREIFSLELDGKLVVLSACETARSQVQGGDEMMGLLRGFFFAGANEVVASLWMVDDESTAQLMGRFHSHLKKHSPAEALRLAQNELIDSGSFSDPYYWAAFGAYGVE